METSIPLHDFVQIVDNEVITNEKYHKNGLPLGKYDVTTELALKS